MVPLADEAGFPFDMEYFYMDVVKLGSDSQLRKFRAFCACSESRGNEDLVIVLVL